MLSALALTLLGLVQADAAGAPAAPESHAVVVVALPANAKSAMVEALNRLRGEATSVGFEVRFVEAGTEAVTLDRLEKISRGLRPAAVVTFAGPLTEADAAKSLDVWFMDRASGRTSVAHLEADKLDEGEDRGEVLLAVRAVDFIRARMFDTLARRQVEPEPAVELRGPKPRERRAYVAAGVNVLGNSAGFLPAFAPQIELGYRWIDWSRIGISAFGLGTRPEKSDSNGTASVELSYVGVNVTWLAPGWRRLRPAVDTGVGEYWARVRGQPLAGTNSAGVTTTLSSPGVSADLRLGVEISPTWSFELLGGAGWFQSQFRVESTRGNFLGSLGRPIWLGSLRLSASF